ncbi:MAG TPA: outer membrane beta-barrel protein, partial [Fimbriimonas sp.]
MKNSALMALALGCAAHAYAVEDPKPLDLGGFVDLYYQYDFGQPRTIAGSSPAAELNLRQFDIRHNRFRLATAWLDVALAPTDRRPLGFYATLMAGETAEILHLLEPGGVDNWKHIGQAYVSYRAAGPVPITVDLGKFWTAIGYEVADQRVAESYSRGINYTFNQPI